MQAPEMLKNKAYFSEKSLNMSIIFRKNCSWMDTWDPRPDPHTKVIEYPLDPSWSSTGRWIAVFKITESLTWSEMLKDSLEHTLDKDVGVV